jgi:hypothetical protein
MGKDVSCTKFTLLGRNRLHPAQKFFDDPPARDTQLLHCWRGTRKGGLLPWPSVAEAAVHHQPEAAVRLQDEAAEEQSVPD